MKKNKFRFLSIFSIVIFLVTILLSFTSFFQHFELKWIDTNFALRGEKKISDEIVIAAITDQSDKELGRFPYPRSFYAKLIENLNKAGAKLIVFDIEFAEQTQLEEDEKLGETAAKYGNVIFAGKIVREKIGNSEQIRIQSPIPEITDKKIRWGLVSISQDEDNFARQYSLFSKYNKENYYSLGICALQELLKTQKKNEPKIVNTLSKFGVGHYIFPKYSANTTFINYYGPAGTFPTFSLDTILDDEKFITQTEEDLDFELNTFNEYLKENTFQDKIVLVGATIEELHDLFSTPFYNFENKKQLTSGVEIHANFLEMVFNHDFIYKFNFLYFIIGLLILIFLANFIFSFFKPTINIIISIFSIGGYFYLAFYLFASKNIMINISEVPTAIFLSFLGNLVYQYYLRRKEKQFLKTAFQQYVAEDVVNKIIKNPKELKFGGKSQKLTVLFSDIRSFTTFSENHKTSEVVEALREYLSAMVEIIKENKGIVDKFVGDEIMALFGVPYYYEEHVYNACKTALMMADKLRELQQKWKKEGREILEIGIGIHTGNAIVGNLGSELIFDYTAIGDTINCGARIEPENKNYKTKNHILISGVTYEIVKDKVEAKFLDTKILRGRKVPTKLYELIGLK